MIDLRWVAAGLSGAAALLAFVRLVAPGPWTPGTRFAVDATAFVLILVAVGVLLKVVGIV